MKLHEASIDDVRFYALSEHGPDASVSDHFTLIEFACKDGSDVVLIHPWLLFGLDMLRRESEGPVILTNAYRTVSHNRKVGGAHRSKHLYGLAADVVSRAWTPDEVASWAERKNWGGIGRYRTFTHLDVYGLNRGWEG